MMAGVSPNPELAAEVIAAIKVDALVDADPDKVSALGRYAYLRRTREGMRLGLKFGAVRDRRRSLGLPIPRLIAPPRLVEFVDASDGAEDIRIEVEEIDLGIGPQSAPSNENVITGRVDIHASTA